MKKQRKAALVEIYDGERHDYLKKTENVSIILV